MSIDRTNPTPPRSVQENLAGYKARAERLDGRVKQLETELKKVRDLMNHANADARAMDAMLDGLGATLREEADYRHRLHSADPTDPARAARSAQAVAALNNFRAITGRTA